MQPTTTCINFDIVYEPKITNSIWQKWSNNYFCGNFILLFGYLFC